MKREWCSQITEGVRIAVQITPNARKNEVIEVQGELLKLKLQAQPIEGKANEALIKFLAECFSVPKGTIHITHGQTARKKLVEIRVAALTPDAVKKRLLGEISAQ